MLTKRLQHELNIYDVTDGEIVFKRCLSKTELKPPYALDALFSQHYDLLLKLEGQKKVLSHHGTCENACATSDAYKLKPIIKEAQGNTPSKQQLKIINTGTIGRYVSKWGHREMTYLGGNFLRPVVEKSDFQMVFPNSYGKKGAVPKIIVKGLNLLNGCLDAVGEVIPGKTTLMITSTDVEMLKTLLAIVNSKLAFFYLREKYPASSYNEGTTFTKEMINNLPIPHWSVAERKALEQTVDEILTAKARDPSIETTEREREIDQRLYTLYGLTPEEIAIVEGTAK